METMERKNKVATVKMEKMEGPAGKAVLEAARGVVVVQGSTVEAGRQQSTHGGSLKVLWQGGQAGRQGCPDVEPASGGRWEDAKNGISQGSGWLRQALMLGTGCGGRQWRSL